MTCASTRSEPVDDLLRLLADSCRRTLLHVLGTGPSEKPVDDVVDRVVAESVTDGRTPPDRGRIRTELHHKHLPRLDERDVVDYDPERSTVRYQGCEDLEALLDSIEALETDTT